ncbi:MAG: sialidase family protein [Verrucomicrobiota bacterium]|jgi:sialidase-1|nr:sialidase family protein [Verrucomicrobiota bacterium]
MMTYAKILISLYLLGGATSSVIMAQVLEGRKGPTSVPSGVHKAMLLKPGPGNPRNSEGDFIQLRDGRVLFVYSHFTDGSSDHASAFLASRISNDGGYTWSDKDEMILRNEGGFNVMSVSLLRLNNGQIAMFYLRKNSLEDCRPWMRLSTDEALTWSAPVEVIADQVGYYVLNNDRVIQLKNGKLICPVALHHLPEYEKPDWKGLLMCYVSDDSGMTWRRSASVLKGTKRDGSRTTFQEPGVIELTDGRLMMWVRSDGGSQYLSWSEDEGNTWSQPVPSEIRSPVSPASMERIPETGDLLLVWNNHADIPEALAGRRTPFSIALSRDEGRHWTRSVALENDPEGWYCYTAIECIGDQVILGHSAGDRRTGGLNSLQLTRFGVSWLYDILDEKQKNPGK